MGHMGHKDKADKASLTKVFIEDFNGKKTFAIFPVNEKGEKFSEFPKVSFGKVKAEFIYKHLEELKQFLGIQ